MHVAVDLAAARQEELHADDDQLARDHDDRVAAAKTRRDDREQELQLGGDRVPRTVYDHD